MNNAAWSYCGNALHIPNVDVVTPSQPRYVTHTTNISNTHLPYKTCLYGALIPSNHPQCSLPITFHFPETPPNNSPNAPPQNPLLPRLNRHRRHSRQHRLLQPILTLPTLQHRPPPCLRNSPRSPMQPALNERNTTLDTLRLHTLAPAHRILPKPGRIPRDPPPELSLRGFVALPQRVGIHIAHLYLPPQGRRRNTSLH